MADGSITFKTEIDNSDVQKQLNMVEREIERSQKRIARAQSAKMPLLEQSKELGAALDEAKYKLAQLQKQQAAAAQALSGSDPQAFMDASAAKPELDAAVLQQQKDVDTLQKKWDHVNNKIDDYDRKIDEANADLSVQTEKAAELTKKLSSGGAGMADAMAGAQKSVKQIRTRLAGIVKQVLLFSVVSKGLRGIASYFGKALNTNKEFNAQLAKLKGALLTAFQPLYEMVLPGLMAVLRALTAIVQVVASFLSLLSGKSSKQSAESAKNLYEEAEALDEVGGSAKKASKSLAGFDEINTLDAPDTGGASADITMPDFSAFETFEDGIDWENLKNLLLGLAIVVGALGLAFGFTGLKIGLFLAGIALVALALNEWITTGELTNETLTALVTGILLIGAAISLLTGSWIPLAIAALVGFVLAVVTKGDEIKAALQKLNDWLQGVFEKDWKEVFGPGLGGALNWLVSTVETVWVMLKGILEGIIDFIGGTFSGDWEKAWGGIEEFFLGFVNGIIGCINTLIVAAVELVNAIGSILGNISFTVPDWVPGIGGKHVNFGWPEIEPYKIPYLAQGAVIPPNAPFMAMLGDQKNGTNIEAPLSTIQEALANVLAERGIEDIKIIFTGDLAQLGRVLKPVIDREGRRVGGSLAKGANT